MASKIKISDGIGKVVSIWTEDDSSLTLESLNSVFFGATNLICPVDEREKVYLRIKNGRIYNPDGWDSNVVYLAHFGSRSTSPIQAVSKASISKFFNYLYYLMEGNTRHCITIAEKDLAITASHCIPKNKQNGDSLTIFDQAGQSYQVSIIFRNKELDLALLKPTEKEFDIEPLEVGTFDIGTSYFALGYPLDEDNNRQFTESPNAVKGCVMTGIVRKNCVYGDSGGSKGFSGGPVISLDHPRHLLGIAMGGKGLPKTWPLNDFLVRALNFCGETPRLKILPASSAMVFKTANVERRGVKRSGADEDMENDNE